MLKIEHLTKTYGEKKAVYVGCPKGCSRKMENRYQAPNKKSVNFDLYCKIIM